MKIAVTYADLVFPDDIRIFSNGHHLNVLLWYHFFEKCGFDVIFISDRMETDTIINNNCEYKVINYIKWFEDENLLVKENIDSIFIAGLTDGGLCKLMKKHNIYVIYSMMGNNYIHDIDTVIYDTGYLELVPERDIFDEIWVSPHFEYSIEYYKIRYGMENILVGPYIWSDYLVKGKPTQVYNKGDKLNVAICEPNICDKKNCMIPICICEKGEQYIEKMRCYCTTKLRENKYFVSFASSLNINKKGKALFNDRFIITDILNTCNCVVSTTQECDLNYVFLECFYFGIPLIHNSKMLQEYGYYYPDLDISKGVEQIENVFKTHNTKLYIEKHKPLLHKYSMNNTYYQEWVKSRLVICTPQLCDIVDNTLTDKNTTHSYLDLYEKLLHGKRKTAKNVLEIGLGDFKEKNGGSVKMWFDYFKQANIFCLDIIPFNRVVDELINVDRIILYMETDAYNENTFNTLFKSNNILFDFILDDGPHTLESMLQCIKLYSQLLTNDGILIIEDVQQWGWINILKRAVPVELKKYIHTYDLRKNKNRYDDIVFTINKCINPNFINENNITIILTCTVNVNIDKDNLVQTCPKERANTYIKSILQWLNDTTFNIIVVENSDYSFEELNTEKEKYNSRFEIIKFNENTHENAQYLKNNKSKGDSEIFSINYAFDKSNLIQSSHFIIKVTGRYFIPTLEDYLHEFNLNEYECLTQNNRNRCEMVGCHYTNFLDIFNTNIDDINKNMDVYSYNGHIETLWKYRTSLYKNLHCKEFQIENTPRGGLNESFNTI